MGACGSADKNLPHEQQDEKQKDAEIQKTQRTDNEKQSKVIKLLLLGAGESGKSTICRQFKCSYAGGFTEDERKEFVRTTHNNTLEAMKTLCIQSDLDKNPVMPANRDFKDHFKNLNVDNLKLTPDLADMIEKLWADPAIRKGFETRARFQLIDSAAYFFGKVKELCAPDYRPSDADILQTRVRSTGIYQFTFTMDEHKFLVVDVGGQRNERRKWIHCFEGVTAVIFVAAISEYDQVIWEDQNTGRMTESLKVFDEVCNGVWFERTPIILFLNKSDLFEEKLKKVPLNQCFPEYNGPQEKQACVDFITKQYLSKSTNPHREIYPHLTCATNRDNVQHVFSAIKDIIITRSLREMGQMS